MKKKYILISAAIIIILAVFYGGYFASSSQKKEIKEEITENKEGVALVVSYGEGESQNFNLGKKENATILDLLRESGLAVETKDYDFGIMIESINGRKNGDGGKYWLYYINGETPMVSADKYIIRNDDKIEFRFEASLF